MVYPTTDVIRDYADRIVGPFVKPELLGIGGECIFNHIEIPIYTPQIYRASYTVFFSPEESSTLVLMIEKNTLLSIYSLEDFVYE